MQNLEEKRVTVMGLGLHGGALGTVKWLLEQGAIVTVTDLKTETELAPTLEKLEGEDITLVLGRHHDEDFTTADLVIRNPGVPKNSPYLQKAREANVPIEMDSSLFFLYCPTKQIVGVTGSKGKTTTARAITAVLAAGGKHVVEVGTDGISPLGKLEEITADTIVVFELSSWRLEELVSLKICNHFAVVTNIYHEHLNTYESFAEYVGAKKAIIRYQTESDIAVLNRNDAELLQWESDVRGKLLWYAQEDVPTNVLLIGEHQQQNLVPAMKIGALYGIANDVMQQTIATTQPLPHRLEFIAEKNGVRYINDSAATMPDATMAALDALQSESIVLILGGSDKKLEFEDLAKCITKANIRALVWLPGTATERIQHAVFETGSRIKSGMTSINAQSMPEAVEKAAHVAQTGDVVLLSPGATSFGLFKHEFDRGDQFRVAVQQLK